MSADLLMVLGCCLLLVAWVVQNRGDGPWLR